MKNKTKLFSLWVGSGKNKMIHVSQHTQNDPCQYYRSKVLSYSFQED